MAFAQVCFSLMNVLARLGARDLPWQEVAASRFLFGALVAYAWAVHRKRTLSITSRKQAWLRSIFGTAAAAGTFFTLASPVMPIGDGATLLATSPLFVAVLSWPLLGEKVRSRAIVALVVSFFGVMAVARPTFHVAGPVFFVALSAAVFAALAMISLRRLGPNETGEAVVLHFSLFGALVLSLLAVPVFRVPDARGAFFLVGTGLVAGVAQLAMTRAYSLASAVTVATLSYLSVVITRFFAWPIFHERPSLSQLLGTFCVIGAGALLATQRVRMKN
jgi:drug/metabolite transporter (DMT)-like permease